MIREFLVTSVKDGSREIEEEKPQMFCSLRTNFLRTLSFSHLEISPWLESLFELFR